MTESTDLYYKSTIDGRDCDDERATVEVCASPEEFGTDIDLTVAAWDRVATAFLTPQQASALVDQLTSAIGYVRADDDE